MPGIAHDGNGWTNSFPTNDLLFLFKTQVSISKCCASNANKIIAVHELVIWQDICFQRNHTEKMRI